MTSSIRQTTVPKKIRRVNIIITAPEIAVLLIIKFLDRTLLVSVINKHNNQNATRIAIHTD